MVPKKATKTEQPCTCSSSNRLRDLDVKGEVSSLKKRLNTKSKPKLESSPKRAKKIVVSKKLAEEVRRTQKARLTKVKARFL